MLVGSAAAALSLSALGSVAEPERGDKGYDKGSKSDMDRDRGSQKSYGDRDKEPAAKSVRIAMVVTATAFDGDNDGDRRWNRPGDRDRIRRGHRYGWGPGVAFYFTDGYYYGNCGWLKRRAIVSGNPIWWRRYHRCRDFD